ADLADANRRVGNTPEGLFLVNEAIDIAIHRETRLSECLANIVLAELCSAADQDSESAAARAKALSRAEALMSETGAFFFKSRIDEIRSDRQADSISPSKAG